MTIKTRIRFSLTDWWMGVRWHRNTGYRVPSAGAVQNVRCAIEQLYVWICVLPCLPICITVAWGQRVLNRFSDDVAIDPVCQDEERERERERMIGRRGG